MHIVLLSLCRQAACFILIPVAHSRWHGVLNTKTIEPGLQKNQKLLRQGWRTHHKVLYIMQTKYLSACIMYNIHIYIYIHIGAVFTRKYMHVLTINILLVSKLRLACASCAPWGSWFLMRPGSLQPGLRLLRLRWWRGRQLQHIPYAPCMEYIPTFTPKITQM